MKKRKIEVTFVAVEDPKTASGPPRHKRIQHAEIQVYEVSEKEG